MTQTFARTDAALAAFFMGEGCLSLFCSPEALPNPRATVALRFDDADVLKQFQQRFGGSIHNRGRVNDGIPRSPVVCWTLCRREDLARFVALLVGSPIAVKKRAQAELVHAALAFFPRRGQRWSLDALAQVRVIDVRLRALKRAPAEECAA